MARRRKKKRSKERSKKRKRGASREAPSAVVEEHPVEDVETDAEASAVATETEPDAGAGAETDPDAVGETDPGPGGETESDPDPAVEAGPEADRADEQPATPAEAPSEAEPAAPDLEAADAAYGEEAEPADLAAGDAGAEVDTAEELEPTSTPEARERLLAEALAHAEMQEARYRVSTGTRTASRIKGTVALALFTVATFLAIMPPDAVRPDPPARLEDADLRRGLLVTLLLQAEQVEAFRATRNRLPGSIEELDGRLPGVRYVRSSNRLYQLIVYTRSGQAIVYDSAAPSAELAAMARLWDAGGGS